MSLSDYIQQAAPEDVFRLKAVELWVPTDEQIAKMRANNPDIPVHVSLKVSWEPMTYRKLIGDELIPEEVDYIRVTKGKGLSDGNEYENVQRVRAGGFPAIPADARMKVPDYAKAVVEKQEREFPRFYVSAGKAGLVIDVDEDGSKTGTPGGVYSPQVGKIYLCQTRNEYPTVNQGAGGSFGGWNWDETKTSFVRVPLREVTDFVQPEQLPERRYERKENSPVAAVTTTTAAAPVSTGDLRSAVALLGIEGKTVSVVNASAASLVASNISKAPAVLGSGDVNRAAISGRFVDYLAEQGVVEMQDGKVVLVG